MSGLRVDEELRAVGEIHELQPECGFRMANRHLRKVP